MKYAMALVALLPVQALAHGAHPPVAAEHHGLAHAMPVLIVLVLIAAAAAYYWRARQ